MSPSQAEEHRDNGAVTRLLWEVHALHNIDYHTWRLEAEQYLVYPDNPLGAALLVLRAILQQESWLSEMVVEIGGKRDLGDG